jgi:hypothetical protein
MSSYRAEAYGKIAWLIFLKHYATFFNVTIRCTIKSYCDNKELVNQTRFSADPSNIWECMRADYDILNEIAFVQGQLRAMAPRMIQGQWVKGHQDATTPLNRLSLPALLNIEADKLATEALQAISITALAKPLPTIPWTQCNTILLVDGAPYTRAETYQLRWKWRESEFQYYLSGRWNMSQVVMNTINWAGLRLARNNLSLGERIFATKLQIGWLATGTRMEKYGNSLTECHRCGGMETTDHLFRCPESNAQQQSLLVEFQSYLMSIKTSPAIVDAMIQGVQIWSSEENDVEHGASQRELQRYTNSHQTAIGWNLFMRGIIASIWSVWQQEYLIHVNGSIRGTEADKWSSRVSLWLIRQAHKTWKTRNEQLHRPSTENRVDLPRAELELHEQVRKLYEQQEHLNYHDKDLFAMPLPERLQQPIQSLKAWLHSTTQTVQICKAKYVAEIAHQHNDIRHFLPPAPVPTTILNADFGDSDSDSDYSNKTSSSSSSSSSSSRASSTRSVEQEAPVELVEPSVARQLVAARAKQKKLSSFNFKRSTPRYHALKSMEQQDTSSPSQAAATAAVPREANQQQAETNSVNPYARTRNQTASTVNNARIWDTTRTEREGGGSAMKTAKYRNQNSDNVTDWATST